MKKKENERRRDKMLHLYNSLTRKKKQFKQTEKNVKIYTCGPSTYMRPHIGNYRTFLYEDILQRYLEYLGYEVTRLMTLTDVEDKAIAEARKENVTLEELTSLNETQLFKDFELLRIKLPQFTVRASTAVDQAAELVNVLTERGIAYWHPHDGRINAYFEPSKFNGFGKLAHLDMSDWPKQKRRFHKDTYPGTPWNRGDFVIWHGCKTGDVCWDTEVGKGRPAWNIQDAAIVTKHLGFHVEIGAGGIDNLVRHHDYTLAIAESISGKSFADFWLHGAHLLVEGSKMSKSKGNVVYPDELTSRGFGGEHIRFFLIHRHYRKRYNFTQKKFVETATRLNALRKLVSDLKKARAKKPSLKGKRLAVKIALDFEAFMNNDLDVNGAFNNLYKAVSKLDDLRRNERLGAKDAGAALEALKRADTVLKVIF
jgi:cysteinyl-tRNA synthetase